MQYYCITKAVLLIVSGSLEERKRNKYKMWEILLILQNILTKVYSGIFLSLFVTCISI
jgi:hypothetical protein